MASRQCILKCVRSLCRWFLFRGLTRHRLRSLTEVKTEQVSCHMKTSHTPMCSSASWGLEACLASIGFKALPIPPTNQKTKIEGGFRWGQNTNRKKMLREVSAFLFASLSLSPSASYTTRSLSMGSEIRSCRRCP